MGLQLPLRALAKQIAYGVMPGVIHAKAVQRAAAKEAELKLLPFLCRPDQIAIDVGANLGLYVHYLLSVAKVVVAFEPNPAISNHVRRFYPQARLETVALSDQPGRASLRMPAGNTSWGTLAETNTLDKAEAPIQTVDVTLATLDSFQFTDIGLIKIDVEGHEEAVIAGSRETLSREQPSLIIEIEERHNPGSVKRMFDRLSSEGYAGYYLWDGALVSTTEFDADRDQQAANVGDKGKVGRYINNFIFVPRSRADGFVAASRTAGFAH
jgi:FkbM family methyltransferase